MTAPEREALVKARVYVNATATMRTHSEAGYQFAQRAQALLGEIDAALASPAVTVTEDARNGDYSGDISPEAFETLRKSVEGVNSSRLDRAVETLNNYTVSDRFPHSERDAVLEEAAKVADPKKKRAALRGSLHTEVKKDQASAAAINERKQIAAAIRALKSTTPQTGSQE